jgi:ribonuclease T2
MFKTSQRIILIKIILILCIVSFNIAICFARINHRTEFTSGEFDYYVFAQSWYPTFCLSGPKNECKNLTKYMMQNLSPHGLWPSKNNVKNFSNHPSHCIKSTGCKSYESCTIDWHNINISILKEIQTMMPTNCNRTVKLSITHKSFS